MTKEFFLFLLRDLLDLKYGMFKNYEDTRTIWFNPSCFETDDMFYLIGVLCGLAIYNQTIIQLPFPLVLYKKMCGYDIGTLEDLDGLSPSTAKGLRQLLEYEGDDFEDVFGINFTYTIEAYGEVQTVDLIEKGADVPVTKENREDYVAKFSSYMLYGSVKDQFEAFLRGFNKVCKVICWYL